MKTRVISPRIEGFFSCKRRVIGGFDYRMTRLEDSLKVLKKKKRPQSEIRDLQSRIDEIETLRHFVKGMVVKS